MLFQFVVALLHATGLAAACSTRNYTATYDDYPDCGRHCLACPDESYRDNFANNCDYAEGECCDPELRTVIQATWFCVREYCKDGEAIEAFRTFEDVCDALGKSLDNADIPSWVHDAASDADSTGGKGPFDNLTFAEKAGVITSIVSVVVGGVALYLTWRYRRNRRAAEATTSGSLEPTRSGNGIAILGNSQASQIAALEGDISISFVRKIWNWREGIFTKEVLTISRSNGNLSTVAAGAGARRLVEDLGEMEMDDRSSRDVD